MRDVSTWEIELSRKWHSTKHFFFWLCWRRQHLARSRRRRILAAQSIELAVVVAQWSLTSHVAISVALRLLQGNRLERRVWMKPRSASFYQNMCQAGMTPKFCVSRANFAYLVNELQPVLQRHELLRNTNALNSCIRPHVQKAHHFFVSPCHPRTAIFNKRIKRSV